MSSIPGYQLLMKLCSPMKICLAVLILRNPVLKSYQRMTTPHILFAIVSIAIHIFYSKIAPLGMPLPIQILFGNQVMPIIYANVHSLYALVERLHQ